MLGQYEVVVSVLGISRSPDPVGVAERPGPPEADDGGPGLVRTGDLNGPTVIVANHRKGDREAGQDEEAGQVRYC